MERLLEDISFTAPEMSDKRALIDQKYVHQKLDSIVEDLDLSRYIL